MSANDLLDAGHAAGVNVFSADEAGEEFARLRESFTPEPMRPADYYENLPQNDLGRHRAMLEELAVGIDARVIVELGVRFGVSTSALVSAADRTGGTVYAIEKLWPAPFTHPRLSFLSADSLDPSVGVDVPAGVDLLFIDTTHTYAQTSGELETWGERVRPGGLIVCHDVNLAGVMRPLWDYWISRGGVLTLESGDHGLGILEVGE